MDKEEKLRLAQGMARALISHFEGFSSKPYLCPGGYLTIGYGHKIEPGEEWTETSQEQAEIILNQDIKMILGFLEVSLQEKFDELNENQLAALISFVFNVGRAAFQESTVRRKILAGAPVNEITSEMARWVYSNGKPLPGLARRRRAEIELFLSGKKEQ
jgi:lysozyme